MISSEYNLAELLKKYKNQFHKVVHFNPNKEKLIQLDFTANNKRLGEINLANIDDFCAYINALLAEANASFGIGGYNELRTVYSMSSLFDNKANKIAAEVAEPRRLHLGLDIWGNAGTEIYAPMAGTVHSFAFNNNFGDYGATIILKHEPEDFSFYTLYGHLSLDDLNTLKEGDLITKGQIFAHFGRPEENGHWPPHLHFQVIKNIGSFQGDYPGVCRFSEKEGYLLNCPDPDFIANMNMFIC